MKPGLSHHPTRLEQILALVALVLLLMGCFVVMKPFLSAGLWAIVLGFSLWPVQSRLTRWMRGRRTLAAVITTVMIAVILVGPFMVIGFSLADDARALGGATRRWLEAGPPEPPTWLEKIPMVGGQAKATWTELAEEATELIQQLNAAADQLPGSSTNEVVQLPPDTSSPPLVGPKLDDWSASKLVERLKHALNSIRTWLFRAGLAIGRGAMEVGLSVFLTFFILRDGAAVAERLATSVDRIAGQRGSHLLGVACNTVRGVVYGILGTAMVQGVMAGIGFLIAGVPGAALLGLLTFFLSPVPVGPPMVWIPAVIWLFQQDATGWAVFMLIWGLGVSSIDNVVKPWLISQGSDMPFILIFFGVIGGAFAFGLIGVFLGPTLLAVSYRLVEEWSAVGPAAAPAPAAPQNRTINPAEAENSAP